MNINYMKYLIILIPILFSQISVFGQSRTLDNLDDVKEECEKIVNHFSKDEIAKAFEKLIDIWILPPNEITNLESQTIKQLNVARDRFGEVIGSEFVKEELIEKVLFRRIYVMKFDKHAIRLIFTFYNGKDDQWMLNGFKWDDSISALFEN